MANVQDQIAKARSAGYSDDEIAQKLSATSGYSDKIKRAKESGYDSSAIIGHLTGRATTTAATPKADPTEGNSFLGNLAAGLGSGIADIGLGVRQGLNTISQVAQDRFGGVPLGKTAAQVGAELQAEIADKRALDAALLETAGGKVGNIAAKAAPAVVAGLVPGGQSLVGSALIGGLSGAAEPTLTDESTLANVVLGAGGGVAGYGVGKGIGNLAARVRANAAQRGAQNALVDANTKAMREAGYVIPISQSNPDSTIANTVDIIAGGRPKLSQAASIANQPVTNKLAARALGLPTDQPITQEVLNQVRSTAYQSGYEPIKQSGIIIPKPAYEKALNKIAAESQGAARSFPGAAPSEIPGMIDGLRVTQFDAGDAIDMTKVLRNAADKAYRSGDAAFGKASKDASKALEDAIEDHLSTTNPDALKSFRQARQLIAKTYSVGNKALNEETGNVSATELARQLAAGKPLSDELLQIARAARLSPTNMRTMQYTTPAASQLETLGSAGAALGTGNPLLLGLPYARAGLRNALLSDTVQGLVSAPSYGGNAALNVIGSEAARAALQGAGVQGGLSQRVQRQRALSGIGQAQTIDDAISAAAGD